MRVPVISPLIDWLNAPDVVQPSVPSTFTFSKFLASIFCRLYRYFDRPATPSPITATVTKEIRMASGVQEIVTFSFAPCPDPDQVKTRTLTTTIAGAAPVVQPVGVADTSATANFPPNTSLTAFLTDTNAAGTSAQGNTLTYVVGPQKPGDITAAVTGEVPATP